MEQRQQGKVFITNTDGTAVVQIRRRGACSEGKCSHGQFFSDVNQQLTIDARNMIGAHVGDWVEVAYDASLALRAAFSIYILPILIGLLGYGVLTYFIDQTTYWIPGVTMLSVIGTFVWSFRRYSSRKFSYSITALVDERVLPVAPACQGCSLATEKLVKNLRNELACDDH